MSSRRGVSRSIRLFRSFGFEQSDPEVFYGAIARDSISLISDHARVADASVLDVGAGREQFDVAFRDAGAHYVALDPDVSLLGALDEGDRQTVIADGMHLPFADGSWDITFCSNVLEHVPDPRGLVVEMGRVTKPGGHVVVSYTNWLGPWGGHETAPFHFLGGEYAARRYERRTGHAPKNRFGESLFPLSVAEGLRIGHSLPGLTLLEARPRYHPDWATFIIRVPGVRELVTWNLWMVLRRDR